jgi:hypothetical protein
MKHKVKIKMTIAEKRLKMLFFSEMVPLSISTRLFYRYDMVQSASANHGLVW